MRVVIQRVSNAEVNVAGSDRRSIGKGLVVLLGVRESDTEADIEWLVNKIIRMRIFNDANGVMNRSVQDIGGEVMIVSQFTLYARVKKGNRPSYTDAAPGEVAVPLYQKFVARFNQLLGKRCVTGEFGADMAVKLINDGPVTIVVDTEQKR